jgi:hypothetical protein
MSHMTMTTLLSPSVVVENDMIGSSGLSSDPFSSQEFPPLTFVLRSLFSRLSREYTCVRTLSENNVGMLTALAGWWRDGYSTQRNLNRKVAFALFGQSWKVGKEPCTRNRRGQPGPLLIHHTTLQLSELL